MIGLMIIHAAMSSAVQLRRYQSGTTTRGVEAHLLQALRDKAELAGIVVRLVDERGTSSTCPACRQRSGHGESADAGDEPDAAGSPCLATSHELPPHPSCFPWIVR
jgi:hypothetical protein